MKHNKWLIWFGVLLFVLMMVKGCSNAQKLEIIENGTDAERHEVFEELGFE